MTYSVQMLRTHPRPAGGTAEVEALAACIDACFDCAETCAACADACLGESHVHELVDCVRLNLDCADICETTGKLLARQTGGNAEVVRKQLEACMAACRACADECDRHAAHDHCALCSAACRLCEQACVQLLQSPNPTGYGLDGV